VLVVGNITDFSKTFKGFSQLLKQGMEGPIDKINDAGGINGKKIQMVYLDDAYNPKKTLQNVNTLLDTDKTDILLSAHGTSTLDAYINLIKQQKILSIFPITGSFRDAALKNLIFLRASFVDEGHALAKYILKRDESLQRVAFFYQDDQFGKDLVKGAQEVFEKQGGIEFKMVPYKRNISQLKEQAKMIADFKPQALSLFGSDVVAQVLIKELGTNLLIDTLLFANRSMGKKSFKDFIAEKGLKLVVTQVVPNPETSNLTIVQDFRQYAQDANVPIDSVALEGYINAALFIDLLEKMNMPFTKQKFIQAAENIKNYDFKGLQLNFDPQTRQLLHSLWIDNGKKEWEQISVD
jgi:ABC-type branched-subunit amino acid transport system substrate-binding protein